MAIYHLTVKTGSRQSGQSAAAKVDYIERKGKYGRDPSEVLHSESGHMPAFAQHDHRAYWQAADLHERANGRLFKEVEFALPVELSLDQQRQLAHDFAQRLTGEHRLPYTLAIHRGDGTNPHCHLIISERQTDEHQRTAAQHFARYNARQPDQGGARKTDALKPKEWLAQVRADWAERANAALEQAGHSQRIDHRSLEAQGIDRLPTRHLGPAALGYERRTDDDSRRRLDMRDDRRVVLERLQAAAAAGDELRAAKGAWVRSALDVRSLGREREAMIERAMAAREALYERYRAGPDGQREIELANAYGLRYDPRTAAEAESLQRQVDTRMRRLDEIEAEARRATEAPKPTLADLIQQPQRAPEPQPAPVPKVDTPAPAPRGADLGALLAAGSRAPSEPLPSPSGASGGFPGARRSRVPTSPEADAYTKSRSSAADQIAAMVEARANAEPVRWHEYESDGERYRRDAERAQDARRVEWLHDGTGEWHAQPQAVIDQHAGRQPEPEQQQTQEQKKDLGRSM